jgi:hypothetical protein
VYVVSQRKETVTEIKTQYNSLTLLLGVAL